MTADALRVKPQPSVAANESFVNLGLTDRGSCHAYTVNPCR